MKKNMNHLKSGGRKEMLDIMLYSVMIAALSMHSVYVLSLQDIYKLYDRSAIDALCIRSKLVIVV